MGFCRIFLFLSMIKRLKTFYHRFFLNPRTKAGESPNKYWQKIRPVEVEIFEGYPDQKLICKSEILKIKKGSSKLPHL